MGARRKNQVVAPELDSTKKPPLPHFCRSSPPVLLLLSAAAASFLPPLVLLIY